MDLDVLVPFNTAHDAVRIFREHGFQPIHLFSAADMQKARHSLEFQDTRGTSVDLHWNSLVDFRGATWEQGLWQRSESALLNGLPIRIPGPADLLVTILLHASRYEGNNHFRWIVDSLQIIKTRPDLDWNVVLAEMEKRRMTAVFKFFLGYLYETFEPDIPAAVIDTVRQSKSTFRDWIRLHSQRTAVPYPIRIIVHHTLSSGSLASVLQDFPRLYASESFLQQPSEIPGYLVHRLGAKLARRKAATSSER